MNPVVGQVRMEALGEAFGQFGKSPVTYVVAALPLGVIALVGFTLGAAMNFWNPDAMSLESVFGMLGLMLGGSCLSMLLIYMGMAGLTNLAVMHLQNKPIKASDGLSMNGRWPSVLAATLAMMFMVSIASVFCCIPAFILNGLFMLTYPLIIQKGMGPIEALQTSFDTLKGDLWKATGLAFIGHLIFSFSQQVCGIGVLVGAPIYAIVIAIVYRDFFILPEQMAQEGGYGAPVAGR